MITLDYTNLTASRVGEHGLSDQELDQAFSRGEAALKEVCELRRKKQLGFAELPYNEEVVAAIENYASSGARNFRNFVHIGIGGSSLGASALLGALCPRFEDYFPEKGSEKRPRFFFIENVDPEETSALFERLNPEETLFHVVTKSGTTAETVAGMMVAADFAKKHLKDKWNKHFVFSTDPQKGLLRKLAKEEKIDAFEIPPPVGGRFSVLSPVGLLPAAVAGLPIRDLTAGAILADEACFRADARRNPAFTAALVARTLDAKGKPMHVLMPYSRALYGVSDWFRQLWAESLGKDGKGPTPIRALGATDQHSQIQLYNAGPNTRVIFFMEVEKFRGETAIPKLWAEEGSCKDLVGRSFSELLLAEKRGTEAALTAAQRPNATIRVPEISGRTLGALFFFFEAMTAYGGPLYGVNTYDQPGVEAGKIATRKFLAGAASPQADARYVVS